MICKLYLRKALVKREKGLNEIFKKKKKRTNHGLEEEYLQITYFKKSVSRIYKVLLQLKTKTKNEQIK